jgi:uncharacterized protein (TIGR02996 family)
MPDEQAFIAAVAATPDDDAVRLVFADWLEDRGDTDRAEFIRVQCELARLEPADARYPDLHLRQLELLARHEQEWLGEWADRLVRWEFRRGLLYAVTITPGPFLGHGNDLFRRHPVERMAFVNEEGTSLRELEVGAVVAAPALRHVRALETAGCRPDESMGGMYGGNVLTNAWLTALAAAPQVGRLEELSLAGATRSGREPIATSAWRLFCRAPHLRTLRCLDLSDAYHNDRPENLVEVMANLGSATFSRSLRSLSWSGCLLTDEAARRLAAHSLPHLEELDLCACDWLRAEGVRALLASPALARVVRLGLPYALDLRELAASPALARLRFLSLGGNASGGSALGIGGRTEPLGRAVGAGEWEVLFRSPQLRNLTGLAIGAYRIPTEAIATLLAAPWASNLRELRLGYWDASAPDFAPLLDRPGAGPTALCKLTVPSAPGLGAALARWPGLAGLTELSFTQCEGATELLRSPFLSARLARLDLTGSCDTPEGARLLADCPALKGLCWLGFGYNGLNVEKMEALLASPYLSQLEALHLGSERNREEDGEGSSAALALLAQSSAWPRLRDVVVGSDSTPEAITVLQARFGPRLRVWSDC